MSSIREFIFQEANLSGLTDVNTPGVGSQGVSGMGRGEVGWQQESGLAFKGLRTLLLNFQLLGPQSGTE